MSERLADAKRIVIKIGSAGENAMSQILIQMVSTFADALICAGGLYMMWLVRPLMGGSAAQPYLLIAIGGLVFIVIDFVSTGTFALVVGMTLVQFLLVHGWSTVLSSSCLWRV